MKTIHGTHVGQDNELVTKPEVGTSKPGACKRKDAAWPQSDKLKKPDTFVKRRRESSLSSLSDVTNENQQPQNISDDEDVYNYDFTGIWENDALDYLPDTSQIAEVLELAFNLKKSISWFIQYEGQQDRAWSPPAHFLKRKLLYLQEKKGPFIIIISPSTLLKQTCLLPRIPQFG